MPKLIILKVRQATLAFSILLITITTSGQHLRRPVPSNYTGLGAYSINNADVFSFTANQASLAQLKNASAGVYAERRFFLEELNSYTAAFGLPTQSGSFGLKMNYYGFSDYNETQIGLAYARKLGTKVDVGAQFNYNGIRIAGYGNDAAVSFEIGTVLHLTDKLHAGVHVNNPVGGKFGKDQQEKIASVYTFAMGFEPSEKFFMSTEIVKEQDQPVNVNAGLQYKFLSRLLARAGISTTTSTTWIGIGLFLKSFRIDVTTSIHSQLGITPGVMLVFNFKSEEK
jgi:hypothetical protein